MSLSRAALLRPRTTLVLAALALALAAPGLGRLELRTDGRDLVPEGDPAVREDRTLRADYGVADPIFVLVPAGPEGVFAPATLGRVVAVTRALERLPGVAPEDVVSLATLPGLRLRPGSLTPLPLLDSPEVDAETAARVAREADRLGLRDGPLVGAGGRSTAVLVSLPPTGDRRAFYDAVRQAAEQAAPGIELAIVGAPVAETLLGRHVLADLGLRFAGGPSDGAEARPARSGIAGLRTAVAERIGLLPLAILTMAAVLAVAFRRPAAVAVPLLKIGAVLVLLFGASGWLGVPFTLVTAVLPVLLTAVGITDEVHLLRRLQELSRDDAAAPSTGLVARAMEELDRPLVETSLTTAVGLASFAVSALPPVRLFGLQAAAGVGLCLLWALTVSPALLALLPRGSWARPAARATVPQEAVPALRSRRWLLALAPLLAGLVLLGVSRLEVQDSWVDGFDPESGFARVAHDFERDYRGLHRLLLSLEAPAFDLAGTLPAEAIHPDRRLVLPQPEALEDPGRLAGASLELAAADGGRWRSWVERAERHGAELELVLAPKSGTPWHGRQPAAGSEIRFRLWQRPFLRPELLARTRELEQWLARQPGVGRVLGPTPDLERAAELFSVFGAPATGLPREPASALAAWSALGRGLGPERLRRFVDPENHARVLVTVVLHEARFSRVAQLLAELEGFASSQLAPLGIRVRQGGDVAVSQALIRSVVSTQWSSLALSIAGILLVATLLGGSLRSGLVVLAAPCLAVLLTFAAMGWAGIPLGVATSLFAGMTLGVGVDSAIHLVARFRRLGQSPDVEARTAEALRAVLPAITIDTAAVGLGFAVLGLSTVPANARLAGLVLISLGACFLATVIVVPALLERGALPGGNPRALG